MRSARRISAASMACGVLALGLFASCSVDERSLSFQLGDVGSASSIGGELTNGARSSAGNGATDGGRASRGGRGGGEVSVGGDFSGSSGSSQSGGSGASSGSGGAAPVDQGGQSVGGSLAGSGGSGGEPYVGPCGDLNQNAVDDCEETLVQNSRFDSAAVSWEAEPTLLQQWLPENARGGPSSGSLSLLNVNVIAGATGNSSLGSRQCLATWGKNVYELAARVFIKGGQGGGAAAFNLLIFGNDNCQGTFLGGHTPATVDVVDDWQVLRATVKMPPGARSAWFRLVADKPFAQSSLEVRFDDVLVAEK